MTPCLQPEEFVDLLDGAPLPADRRAHVEVCAACQTSLADLAAALEEARAGDIPEPSPFFWTSLNARVRAAVEAAPRFPRALTGIAAWLRWDTIVPLAGMAAVLVALATAVDRVPRGDAVPAASLAEPAISATPAPSDAPLAELGGSSDDALALVLELASSLPDAGGDAIALSRLPDLGVAAAAALSEDEQDALADILRAAVDWPKS